MSLCSTHNNWLSLQNTYAHLIAGVTLLQQQQQLPGPLQGLLSGSLPAPILAAACPTAASYPPQWLLLGEVPSPCKACSLLNDSMNNRCRLEAFRSSTLSRPDRTIIHSCSPITTCHRIALHSPHDEADRRRCAAVRLCARYGLDRSVSCYVCRLKNGPWVRGLAHAATR